MTIGADDSAHIHPDLAQAALRMMEVNMRAQIVESRDAFSFKRAAGDRGRVTADR